MSRELNNQQNRGYEGGIKMVNKLIQLILTKRKRKYKRIKPKCQYCGAKLTMMEFIGSDDTCNIHYEKECEIEIEHNARLI